MYIQYIHIRIVPAGPRPPLSRKEAASGPPLLEGGEVVIVALSVTALLSLYLCISQLKEHREDIVLL